MRAANAPERFDRHIFSSGGVADDAQNPSVNRALVAAEDRFKGFDAAVLELLQLFQLAYEIGLHRSLLPLIPIYEGSASKVTFAEPRAAQGSRHRHQHGWQRTL